MEEIKRLRVIEQTHLLRIHNLEELLATKRQHIARLESRLNQEQNDRKTANIDNNSLSTIQKTATSVENIAADTFKDQQLSNETPLNKIQQLDQEKHSNCNEQQSNIEDNSDFADIAEHIHEMEIKKETQ